MEVPLLLPVSTSASFVSVADNQAASSSNPPSGPSPDDDEDSSARPSTRSIVFRVAAVLVIACASLFAQHEASKGFVIDVVAAHPGDAAISRRFNLLFVSNGRAERILHRASRDVERALFPDASFPRKRVARVTVRMMMTDNLTAEEDNAMVTVAGNPIHRGGEERYVISLSPGLIMSSMSGSAAEAAVTHAVRRAVARMWLWDGRGAVPARVTESMVEYLASSSSSGGHGEPITTTTTSPPAAKMQEQYDDGQQQRLLTCMSARFLRHLERQRTGFVARLNRAMRDRWSDAAVDAALGAPARPVCAAYLVAPRGGALAD